MGCMVMPLFFQEFAQTNTVNVQEQSTLKEFSIYRINGDAPHCQDVGNS